ncbi:MAG: YidH family protein [Acidimicrobiales bacterium]
MSGSSQPDPDPAESEASETTRPDVPVDARFSFANERTFLAWNRTALALVTAGLAVTQLLPPFDVPGGRRMIGIPLIVLGVVVALSSLWQWRANEQAMVEGRPLPSSKLPMLVAVVIGVTALVALALAAFGGQTS